MLLLDGIPKGSFGRHPHYQVWGSQRSLVVALRQIEHFCMSEAVLSAVAVQRNE